MVKIIRCDSSYSAQILEILNEVIANSTALYDYRPRNMSQMEAWFDLKEQHHYPVVGVTDEHNNLLGFGSYGQFRAWPAYKYTIEHSLYIHDDHRGKGLGKVILKELIQIARKQEYHCMVAGIDSANAASKKLHESFGFEYSGTIRHAGFKFSRWLDLEFYQLVLQTPVNPIEG